MNITWNAEGYAENFSFVPRYGEDVLSLLDVKKGAQVIDLGCGAGALTEKLAERGYAVVGVDASDDMLSVAKKAHPSFSFESGDALTYSPVQPADAVFSNAVFHWIDADKQPYLLQNVARMLRSGGQLVCEFGGKGCAEQVHAALEKTFAQHGLTYPRVFYFPTIGEYAPMMEAAGLRVTYAALFDRPTPQKGEDGLERWIRMFVRAPFEGLPESLQSQIIHETVESLRGKLSTENGWIVDYVRIRLKAVKF